MAEPTPVARLSPQLGECNSSPLPDELMEMILAYPDDSVGLSIARRRKLQPTLAALCRSNKRLRGIATEPLYREICISTWESLQNLGRTFKEAGGVDSELRGYVQQFFLVGLVFTSGNPDTPSRKQVRCIVQEIIDQCTKPCKLQIFVNYDTNLTSLTYPEPAEVLESIHALSKLTHLDLRTSKYLLYTPKSKDVAFPHLQSLSLTLPAYEETRPTRENDPVWFQMPKLRHLTLHGFVLSRRKRFSLPNSPLIAIELLKWNYDGVSNLFNRDGLLSKYSETLESLTVTTTDLVYSSRTAAYPLDFLENLVELCIPFQLFKKEAVSKYPRSLETLVVVGDFNAVEGREKYSQIDEDRYEFFLKQTPQGELPNLKRVWIAVKNANNTRFSPGLHEMKNGVELRMGLVGSREAWNALTNCQRW